MNAASAAGLCEPVFRFTCGAKTVYFPGSCQFAATRTGAASDCRRFSTTYTSPTWQAGAAGDGCSSNSVYATLSSVLLDAPCGIHLGATGLMYRRVDWRGESYDLGGCSDVDADVDHDGAVFVR